MDSPDVSEREKSSEPNDLTSSDDRTFHDDDNDDDYDDSSAADMDEEDLEKDLQEDAKLLPYVESSSPDTVKETNSQINNEEFDEEEAFVALNTKINILPDALNAFKISSSAPKVRKELEAEADDDDDDDDEEVNEELRLISDEKSEKQLLRENEKQASEAIQLYKKEIDDCGDGDLLDSDDGGIQFEVKKCTAAEPVLPMKLDLPVNIACDFSKSDSDIEMKELPDLSSEVLDISPKPMLQLHTAFEPSQPNIEIDSLDCADCLPLTESQLQSKYCSIDDDAGAVGLDRDAIFNAKCYARYREEYRRESTARESNEYFYSAQDLLEYGPLLAGESTRTPDVESGYFEKSESDLSRDDIEAVTMSNFSNAIKPRAPPRRRCNTSVSEGLRIELDRFRSMIENIEREQLVNTGENRQKTMTSVLTAERNAQSCENFSDKLIVESKAEQNSSRGYWSTVFGQASPIETGDELSLEERCSDIQKAHRALELLEDYHSRLSEPQDRALRMAIERVIRIFKSRLFQALLAQDFMAAYNSQSQCVQSVVKMLQNVKDENWVLPVMYTVCLDLRILAQKCDKLDTGAKPGEILEKAADCLMGCFRVCAADSRATDEETKRLGMLHLVNQLFKVYFRINKLHLCKPLIRAIESSAYKDNFPLPEQVTYKYFVGRKAMFDSDYRSAEEYLSFALNNCPARFKNNKRLILIYLVPVKMLLGYLPKRQILERYDVLQFDELCTPLKEGNVRKFDEVMQKHEMFFIKSGIYLIVEKLKFNVYRNLFKRIYIIKQTHQLNLNDFCAALKFVGETEMSIDETHCIVCNLILEGKIKGYISYSHNKLVVSKQNPFPPINSLFA